MILPPEDQAFLADEGISALVSEEAGMLCVILPAFALPDGLNAAHVDVLFRLAPTYPDTAPDMWWVSPALTTREGAVIPATELTENHVGRSWQRWSRHLDAGAWKSGIDGLESYVALLREELDRAAGVLI